MRQHKKQDNCDQSPTPGNFKVIGMKNNGQKVVEKIVQEDQSSSMFEGTAHFLEELFKFKSVDGIRDKKIFDLTLTNRALEHKIAKLED